MVLYFNIILMFIPVISFVYIIPVIMTLPIFVSILLQSPLFCICISKLCLVILVCVHNCSSLNVLHLALARTLRPAHGKHVLGSLEVLTSPRKPQPLAEEWVWHQVATFSDIAQVLMPERQPTSLCELSIPICTTSYQKDGNLKDFLILLYMYISYYIYICTYKV